MTDNTQTWDAGWDGHKRAQQRRLARLPFVEKLKWLEEAHHLVLQIKAAKTKNTNSAPNAEH